MPDVTLVAHQTFEDLVQLQDAVSSLGYMAEELRKDAEGSGLESNVDTLIKWLDDLYFDIGIRSIDLETANTRYNMFVDRYNELLQGVKQTTGLGMLSLYGQAFVETVESVPEKAAEIYQKAESKVKDIATAGLKLGALLGAIYLVFETLFKGDNR